MGGYSTDEGKIPHACSAAHTSGIDVYRQTHAHADIYICLYTAVEYDYHCCCAFCPSQAASESTGDSDLKQGGSLITSLVRTTNVSHSLRGLYSHHIKIPNKVPPPSTISPLSW